MAPLVPRLLEPHPVCLVLVPEAVHLPCPLRARCAVLVHAVRNHADCESRLLAIVRQPGRQPSTCLIIARTGPGQGRLIQRDRRDPAQGVPSPIPQRRRARTSQGRPCTPSRERIRQGWDGGCPRGTFIDAHVPRSRSTLSHLRCFERYTSCFLRTLLPAHVQGGPAAVAVATVIIFDGEANVSFHDGVVLRTRPVPLLGTSSHPRLPCMPGNITGR
jgi:hypothetical protein